MTEIVVNRCFGGFGLSNAALKKLVMVDSKCVERYSIQKYYGIREDPEKEFRRDFVKDLGDGFLGHRFYNGTVAKDGIIYDFAGQRDDKDLVAVVMELGKAAWGDHAELKVVSVPDDVEWQIEEYDGREWVSEKHRTW